MSPTIPIQDTRLRKHSRTRQQRLPKNSQFTTLPRKGGALSKGDWFIFTYA